LNVYDSGVKEGSHPSKIQLYGKNPWNLGHKHYHWEKFKNGIGTIKIIVSKWMGNQYFSTGLFF